LPLLYYGARTAPNIKEKLNKQKDKTFYTKYLALCVILNVNNDCSKYYSALASFYQNQVYQNNGNASFTERKRKVYFLSGLNFLKLWVLSMLS